MSMINLIAINNIPNNLLNLHVSKPNNSSTVEFRVSTLKDIVNIIIPHFDNYPLITQKFSDYILFKQIVFLMLDK